MPEGTVTKHHWTSKVFPGTERDYWVYVPKQYDGPKPACVMVFQDGGNYVDTKKDFRVPIVFDNLIHKGEMPVTIGIFINPGVDSAGRAADDKPRAEPQLRVRHAQRPVRRVPARRRSCPRSARSTS